MAITNKKINLSQLTNELNGKGLIANFTDLENKIILPADGVILSENELENAIQSHTAEPTEAEAKATARAEILDRLGLSAEEAAILLG